VLKHRDLLVGRDWSLIANCLPVEDDRFLRVTRPATGYSVHVLRASNWVQTFHKFCSLCQGLQNGCSRASHDSHWTHHIWWIGDLNSNLRQWWANRSHAEWNDIHCATWNVDKNYWYIALKLHRDLQPVPVDHTVQHYMQLLYTHIRKLIDEL